LFTRRQRLARACLIAGTALLLAIGYPTLPDALLKPIEAAYPAFEASAARAVTHVFVLGQGFAPPAPQLPFASQIGDTMTVRLLEAVRVHRQSPDAKIIVSLAGVTSDEEKRRFLDQFAKLVGVAPDAFMLIGDARDTGEEVRRAAELARDGRIAVVTSASHMPRALMICRRHGLDAVPAPCDHRLKPEPEDEPFSPSALFPSGENMEATGAAVHEYMGLIQQSILRQRD